MSAPRLSLPRLLGAATIAACALLGTSGARAQIFVETWGEETWGKETWGERFAVPLYELAPRYRMERDLRLHPAIILDELEDRGFRNLVIVARRADVYVIEGVSPRKGRVRLVVDAYDGEIIRRDTPSRSHARVVGQDRSPTASTASTSSLFAPPAPPVRRMPGTAMENAAPKPVPPKVAGPLSEPPATPALPATRPPSADWNPINSVPVAPLL